MLSSVGVIVLISVSLVKISCEESLMFTRSCWQQNIIPYYIGNGIQENERKELYHMFTIFHKDTCLRWVDYSEASTAAYSPGHHVQFIKVNDGSCRNTRELKSNGSVVTYVHLLSKCFSQYYLMHEMMHVLGFHHEHQRYDRNCYVSVAHAAGEFYSYKIIPQEKWIERYPYDKYSVLHYPRNYLMRSRKEGRRHRGTVFLGNAYGQLTHLDLSKIRFKFCGGPHYCDVSPEDCRVADEWRRFRSCA